MGKGNAFLRVLQMSFQWVIKLRLAFHKRVSTLPTLSDPVISISITKFQNIPVCLHLTPLESSQ